MANKERPQKRSIKQQVQHRARVSRAPAADELPEAQLKWQTGRTSGLGALPGSSAMRAAAVTQMQQMVGNAQVQRFIESLGPAGKGLSLVQRDDSDADAAEEGNPVAPPLAGTTIHPTVRVGSRGEAVEELQQKLNTDGATPALVVDGIFGPLTRAAVVAFQQKYGLAPDGIVGPLTWGKMDELGLASTVGRVERQWEELVGGQTYGMTSRYTWRIVGDEIRITVKLKFTGLNRPALVAQWFSAIRATWNRFDAINDASGERMAINFDPQTVAGGEDNVVEILPGSGRANAGQWYEEDPDSDETASHEFGHMIGLEDEYQRTHGDYKRLTGEEPSAGETTGSGDPAVIAQELHDALRIADEPTRVTDSTDVINNYGLVQGEFAQQVAAAYQTAFGVEIVSDIVDRIPDDDEWSIVDPFTHSSGSIMGMGTNHDHPVDPRHVREFVGYVQQAMGGEWRAEER
jgi:peptidoglycan hydrolase-like protein with peptidoglycan-binding domain